MKIFNITEGEGKLITHLTADNSNYVVTYEYGKLIFTKDDRQYIIPETNADDIYFKRPDPNLDKRKFDFVEYRNIHRDTLPSDFGISNITDVEPSSSHFTNEITLGGVNDKVPVIAPAGVVIYVNGNVVSSGTLVDNGDVIKFEIVASGSYETTSNYNVSIGDITKGFSIATEAGVKANCLEWLNAGKTTDGVYRINPTGNEEFDVYCDMNTVGGGWTLILYHYSGSGSFFGNQTNALTYNKSNPGFANNLYSIAAHMHEIKSSESYEFRAEYPNNGTVNHWKQLFNPLSGGSSTSPVSGYQSINIDWNTNYWGGLERDTGNNTLMDGSVAHSNWFFAIGSYVSWTTSTTFPGGNSTAVNKVKFWLR